MKRTNKLPNNGHGYFWALGIKFYIFVNCGFLAALSTAPLPRKTKISWLKDRCAIDYEPAISTLHGAREGKHVNLVVGDPIIVSGKYRGLVHEDSPEWDLIRDIGNFGCGINFLMADPSKGWAKIENQGVFTYVNMGDATEYKTVLEEVKAERKRR